MGTWEPWMNILAVIALGVAGLVFLAIRRGNGVAGLMGLLGRIEGYEQRQAIADESTNQELGILGSRLTPAPEPVREADAGNGTVRTGAPAAVAQNTIQRLAVLEEAERQRQQQEAERRRLEEEDPVLKICRDRYAQIRGRAKALGAKLGVSLAQLDNLEVEAEILRNQRRIQRKQDALDGFQFDEPELVIPTPARAPAPAPTPTPPTPPATPAAAAAPAPPVPVGEDVPPPPEPITLR